jgi:hypothetical protein
MTGDTRTWVFFSFWALLALLGLVFNVMPLRVRRSRPPPPSMPADQVRKYRNADVKGSAARVMGTGFAVAATATMASGVGFGLVIGIFVFLVPIVLSSLTRR